MDKWTVSIICPWGQDFKIYIYIYIQYFYGEMREHMGHVSSHQYILLAVTYFA